VGTPPFGLCPYTKAYSSAVPASRFGIPGGLGAVRACWGLAEAPEVKATLHADLIPVKVWPPEWSGYETPGRLTLVSPRSQGRPCSHKLSFWRVGLGAAQNWFMASNGHGLAGVLSNDYGTVARRIRVVLMTDVVGWTTDVLAWISILHPSYLDRSSKSRLLCNPSPYSVRFFPSKSDLSVALALF